MAIDLRKLNRNLDNVVQHVLCDLEPDLREPIDKVLGEMLAAITVLHQEVLWNVQYIADLREQISLLLENRELTREHTTCVAAYYRSAS